MQFRIKHALLVVVLVIVAIRFVPVKRDNPASETAQAIESVTKPCRRMFTPFSNVPALTGTRIERAGRGTAR